MNKTISQIELKSKTKINNPNKKRNKISVKLDNFRVMFQNYSLLIFIKDNILHQNQIKHPLERNILFGQKEILLENNQENNDMNQEAFILIIILFSVFLFINKVFHLKGSIRILQRNRLPKIPNQESKNAITPLDDIYSKIVKKKVPLPKIQIESRPIPAKIFEKNISANAVIEEKKVSTKIIVNNKICSNLYDLFYKRIRVGSNQIILHNKIESYNTYVCDYHQHKI